MLLLRSLHPLRASPFRSAAAVFRSRPLAVAFGLSLPFVHPGKTVLLDTSPVTPSSPSGTASFSSSSPGNGRKNVPFFKDGKLNPPAVKQISAGAMLGLGAGLLLSMLSRVLVLVVGVGVVVWQVSRFDAAPECKRLRSIRPGMKMLWP